MQKVNDDQFVHEYKIVDFELLNWIEGNDF